MTLRLVLESGGPVGTVYELREGENVVGRSAQAHVQVVAGDVSRGHLCIRVSGEELSVENLSRYGTTLDNRPLESPTPLTDGQRLKLGRSTVPVLPNGDSDSLDTDGPSPTAARESQSYEPSEEPELPLSSPDIISSDSIDSGMLPSQSIPIDAEADDVESSQPIGLTPAGKKPAEDAQDLEEPLSGHIDFMDQSMDDDLAEPLSMAGIDMGDILGQPLEESIDPVEEEGRSPAEEEYEDEDDDDGPHTQMMSTGAIDYLRERQEQKALIRKIAWIAGGVIGAALVIGLVLRFL